VTTVWSDTWWGLTWPIIWPTYTVAADLLPDRPIRLLTSDVDHCSQPLSWAYLTIFIQWIWSGADDLVWASPEYLTSPDTMVWHELTSWPEQKQIFYTVQNVTPLESTDIFTPHKKQAEISQATSFVTILNPFHGGQKPTVRVDLFKLTLLSLRHCESKSRPGAVSGYFSVVSGFFPFCFLLSFPLLMTGFYPIVSEFFFLSSVPRKYVESVPLPWKNTDFQTCFTFKE
jgi:hypothetical protein